jgi:hypothetical protein
MLADGQARLERARSRSLVVDTIVGLVRRKRPVAVGILAGSLAFRLFALLVPATYVVVAGLGFSARRRPPRPPPRLATTSATWWWPRWPRPPAAPTGVAGWP